MFADNATGITQTAPSQRPEPASQLAHPTQRNLGAKGDFFGAKRDFSASSIHAFRHSVIGHPGSKETTDVKTRRPLAILAATAVAGLGLTALATPASAEGITVTISGTWALNGKTYTGGSVDPSDVPGTTISGTEITLAIATGTTFGSASPTFLVDSRTTGSLGGRAGLTLAGEPCDGGSGDDACTLTVGDSKTFLISPIADAYPIKFITDQTGNRFLDSGASWFKVSYATTPDSDSGSASRETPAPRIQQFEMPSSGTCDEAAPEGLNWGGAASGGWGESWAQWMHEGQGGAVCTRTLAYNNSTGTWQVQ